MQGPPSLKLMFSKHVRKFNQELLKATCLVIGCKRMIATNISEELFREFDIILNNLSRYIDFDQHFIIPNENQGKETKNRVKQKITTITIAAPLFKYILKKYLVDKYNYQRPEYL